MCVQVLGKSIRNASGKCKLNADSPGGSYPNETCLIPGTADAAGKYPVTDGGTISPGRIRNVAVRATQQGAATVKQVKDGGFCSWAKKAKIESSLCGGGN